MLEKYKVEVSNKGVYKGRGEPSEWRMVQRVEKYQPRKWSEDCRAKIFSWFREYDLQRKKGMRESQMEKAEMRQERMKVMTDTSRNNQIKRQN